MEATRNPRRREARRRWWAALSVEQRRAHVSKMTAGRRAQIAKRHQDLQESR